MLQDAQSPLRNEIYCKMQKYFIVLSSNMAYDAGPGVYSFVRNCPIFTKGKKPLIHSAHLIHHTIAQGMVYVLISIKL